MQLPDLNSEVLDDNTELKSYFHCDNSYKDTVVSQRGNYYAIYNFVKAEKEFRCTESVTLSAPGDYRYVMFISVFPMLFTYIKIVSCQPIIIGFNQFFFNKNGYANACVYC